MGLTNNLGKLSNMITSTGSAVGIAQSSPSYTLDVTGTGRYTGSVLLSSSLTVNGVYFVPSTSYFRGNSTFGYRFNNAADTANLFLLADSGAATFSSSVTASNFYAISSSEIRLYNSNNTNWGTIKGSTDSTNGYITLTGGSGNGMIVANSGNVGIGTSSPNALLQVNGSSIIGSGTISNGTAFGGGNQINRLKIETGAYTCLEINGATSGGSIQFTYGSNAPNQVGGLIGYNYASGAANEFAIFNALNGNMVFGTNNTERMRITSGGNLLIGTTTSPTSGGFTNTTVLIKQIANGGAGGGLQIEANGSDNVAFFGFEAANSAFTIGTSYRATGSYQPILFRVGGPERMRISTNGNVSIGTAGLNSSLSVIGTGTIVVLGESGGTAKQLLIGIDGSTGTSELQSVWQGTAYTRLSLNPISGAVYAGAVRLDTLSDARVKDNIQPITNALDKVLSITGKKFHLKDEEENKIRYGFIAQELEGILDEFVIQTSMTFKKDDLKVENVKSIDNWASSWSALLVEAIKEQQKQIEELKLKIK